MDLRKQDVGESCKLVSRFAGILTIVRSFVLNGSSLLVLFISFGGLLLLCNGWVRSRNANAGSFF